MLGLGLSLVSRAALLGSAAAPPAGSANVTDGGIVVTDSGAPVYEEVV